MTVTAYKPGYTGKVRDGAEHFQGKQLLFVGWDDHLIFCSPITLLVSPDMKFRDFVNAELERSTYPQHTDWAQIDWTKVEWRRSGTVFSPDVDKTLAENGLGHKAMLRFKTPGLTGIQGTCN